MKKIIFIVFVHVFHNCVYAGLSPVILVPGDGGSRIEARWDKQTVPRRGCALKQTTWYNMWLNIMELLPYSIDCWASNMRLEYNRTTHTTSPPDGVETRISGFGSPNSVEYLDPSYFYGSAYFHTIAKALVTIGYRRNDTLLAAPYDFRKAPNELGDYFKDLKALIESSYDKHHEKITLLSHSFGGPITYYFLTIQSHEWKDKYIQAFIGLSSPWVGAVKSLKIYAAGYNFKQFLLPSSKLRPIQISNPSLAFLLPSANAWKIDQVLVETPEKNYSISNIKEYFDDLNYTTGYLMYQDTYKLLLNASAPGVEVLCLHGTGVPTTEKVLFYRKDDFPYNPIELTGDGDGTVNRQSLEYCQKWQKQQNSTVHWKTFKGVNHSTILRDPSAIRYIAEYLMKVKSKNFKKSERQRMKEIFRMQLVQDKVEYNRKMINQERQHINKILAVRWLKLYPLLVT